MYFDDGVNLSCSCACDAMIILESCQELRVFYDWRKLRVLKKPTVIGKMLEAP